PLLRHRPAGRDPTTAMRLVIAILILAFTGKAMAQWHNSLQPTGRAAATVTLVEDGKAKCAIVLPIQPTPQEQKAAQDMQRWVREMSGSTLPIAPDAPPPRIVISTRSDFPAEQYQIATEGSNLLLTGGPGRGVINAAYALLEEDMGCRFYSNDSVRLPHAKTLTVAPVPRTYNPQLILRDPFYFASFDADWSLRNRTNAPGANVPEEFGGHVDYGPLFVHTHAQLLPPDKYFKEHPQYFALDAHGKRYPAQLCPSDENVARIVAENVLKFLHDNPHVDIVSVSKNDSGGD